jgi:hypothetical protein
MATQTIVQISDDLDSTPNAEAVIFGFGADTWTIDLSKKNRAALEKALKPYMEAGRKVQGHVLRRQARPTSRAGRAAELAKIRAWARRNGYELSDRGRIAGPIVEAYEAAR